MTKPQADPSHSQHLLQTNLKQLRLPTMLAEHAKLAQEAANANQDYMDYLVRLWAIGADPPYYSLKLPIKLHRALVAFTPENDLITSGPTDGTAYVWRLPHIPADVREMQLRTWIELGATLNQFEAVSPIPSEQWHNFRDELRKFKRSTSAKSNPLADKNEPSSP